MHCILDNCGPPIMLLPTDFSCRAPSHQGTPSSIHLSHLLRPSSSPIIIMGKGLLFDFFSKPLLLHTPTKMSLRCTKKTSKTQTSKVLPNQRWRLTTTYETRNALVLPCISLPVVLVPCSTSCPVFKQSPHQPLAFTSL